MGYSEAMAITNVIPRSVIPFGAFWLWASMVALLIVSAAGIWLAVPRTRRAAASRRRRHANTELVSVKA